MVSSTDVLVVTASPEEFEAAKSAAGSAVRRWEPCDAGSTAPYLRGVYHCPDGRRLTIALARPTEAGSRSTAALTTALVERLRPACVAMCGGCAGNPSETVPGDVVVADIAYAWDEGRHHASRFEGDHRQIPLDPRTLRAAQDLDPAGLPSHGPATEDEARGWLLDRLFRDLDPQRHPARVRYFPKGTWQRRLARYEADGLIVRRPDGSAALTEAGTAAVRRRRYDDVDGPRRLPFRVLVAPMASGSAVVRHTGIWPALARMGMGRIAAVDREAATVAAVARDREVSRWIVAKGVTHHGDADSDGRYGAFGARASAEVLFALVERATSGGGLVDLDGGRLVFDAAVGRIADQLKPLGKAGRVVAESYAVATELRRLQTDAVEADREVRLAALDQRRRESTATLRQMQRELGRADASAKALRECMVNMQRQTVRPGLQPAELLAYRDLTQHFTTMLVQHHTDLTTGVATVIDKVLNGTGAAALVPGQRVPDRRPAADRAAKRPGDRPGRARGQEARGQEARDGNSGKGRRR